jgi:hypothetical protein
VASSFPTGLDSLAKPTSTTDEDDVGFEHDVVHTNAADAVEAVQGKVGIDGSADAASLDYLVKVAEAPGHTHSAAYVAKLDVDKIVFGPADLVAISGSPSVATINSWPVWLLDAAANEIVGNILKVPRDWTSVNVTIRWVNAGTGTGDVNFRFLSRGQTVGDTLTSPAGSTEVVITASGQNVIVRTILVTGVAVNTANDILVAAQRQGGVASDTLPNDIGLLGLTIQRGDL